MLYLAKAVGCSVSARVCRSSCDTASEQLAPEIRVNAVAPRIHRHTLVAGRCGYEAAKAAATAMTPLRRMATPQDVALDVVHLLCADFVTGRVLVCDGGIGLGAPPQV